MCSDLAPRGDGTRRLALDKIQKPSHLDGQPVVAEICQMVRNHPLIIDAGARSMNYECPRSLTWGREGGREGGGEVANRGRPKSAP